MPLAPRLLALPARAERSILCPVPPSRTRDGDEIAALAYSIRPLSKFICDEIFSYPKVRLKLILVSSLTLFSFNGICFQFSKKEIVRCNFLHSVLVERGFSNKWVSSLMSCVTASSLSVLWNGERTPALTLGRG